MNAYGGRRRLFRESAGKPPQNFSFSSIGHKTMGLEAALQAKLDDLAASFGISLKRKTC